MQRSNEFVIGFPVSAEAGNYVVRVLTKDFIEISR